MDLCRNGHDKDVVGRTKQRRCRVCKNNGNARYNATGKRPRRRYAPVPKTNLPIGPDGLEAEYGPVPARVPDSEWYDEVIVRRALTGRPTRRKPYPLEQAAIVKGMTRQHVQTDLADLCGVPMPTFNDWVRTHA